MTMRKETIAALKSFIEKVERLEDERSELADDIRAIYAEAKADGFATKAIRAIVKRKRAKNPQALADDETVLDQYMHATGMISVNPLADAVASLAVDTLARDSVIAALQSIVPVNGEIIAKVGGAPMRIWRDEAGQAFSAEHIEPKPAPAERPGKGLKRSATILSLVPDDAVKAAADRAEKRGKKPKADEPEKSDAEEPVE